MAKTKKPAVKDNNVPLYLFHEGTNAKAYELLGAHADGNTWVFRVWAPNAARVSVCGEFNGWQVHNNPMQKISHGVWECRVEGVKKFDSYKYWIETADGRGFFKGDPFAFHTETRPDTASKAYDIHGYEWTDKKWLAKRKKSVPYSGSYTFCHRLYWRKHRLHCRNVSFPPQNKTLVLRLWNAADIDSADCRNLSDKLCTYRNSIYVT